MPRRRTQDQDKAVPPEADVLMTRFKAKLRLITLKTSPRVRASVYHGKELLGTTPLRLVWPKDTGSLDIKLKASGYLTVNSRLYTHRNDRVTVNMFKVDQAHLLFGYKKKVKESPESNDGEE